MDDQSTSDLSSTDRARGFYPQGDGSIPSGRTTEQEAVAFDLYYNELKNSGQLQRQEVEKALRLQVERLSLSVEAWYTPVH